METLETATYRRFRLETQAYRHYNAYYDNAEYHRVTARLEVMNTATDAPFLEAWEWGNLIQDAALELSGHPDNEKAIANLFHALAGIEPDQRREAYAHVVQLLYPFAGTLGALSTTDELPF